MSSMTSGVKIFERPRTVLLARGGFVDPRRGRVGHQSTSFRSLGSSWS